MFQFFGYLFDLLLTIPCLNVLIFIYRGVGDIGFALLFFAILIQLIFFPLTLYGMRSQKDMEVTMKSLQPQLEALKVKYGDDKQQLRAESQKLYRSYKINPAGGCLSLIIPLLFLGALWFIFTNHLYNDVFHVQPGVLNHLLYPFNPKFVTALNTQPNWLGGYHLDLTRPEPGPISIFAIVAGILAFIQTKITLPGADLQAIIDNPDNTLFESNPKQMTAITPFLIMVLSAASFWVLPVGMTFYWIVTSLIVIGVQLYVNHRYTPALLRSEKPVTVKERQVTPSNQLISIRLFTALDMAWNPKLILIEFLATIVFCGGLSGFIFFHDPGHALFTIVLSCFFVCVAINYVPLFMYAVSIMRRGSLKEEIVWIKKHGDVKRAMLPVQLLLFVPLSVFLISVYQELHKKAQTS